MRSDLLLAVLMGVGLAVAGCTLPSSKSTEPSLVEKTETGGALFALPPPASPIIVAVYDFPDQTGQNKPNTSFGEYSRAVTQGAVNMLIEALQSAGAGEWFVVLERAGLDDLLRERQLIRSTREQYLDPGSAPLPPPTPLLYAPILLKGGIVSYEANTSTGGFGARYLGIGANTEYQEDRVTVALRATSTQNGRILVSTSAAKTIFSALVQGSVFRFIGLDELLEAESGITTNEPPQLAVRRAIEKAVYTLVVEGALAGIWQFADPASAQPLITSYLTERDGAR